MILAMVFGLAPNFSIALVIRTLWGFTNGNIGVIKTYVSEVCSEDMQSLGFSIIVTMGGIAKLISLFYFMIALLDPVWVDFLAMQKRTSLVWSSPIHGFEMYVPLLRCHP